MNRNTFKIALLVVALLGLSFDATAGQPGDSPPGNQYVACGTCSVADYCSTCPVIHPQCGVVECNPGVHCTYSCHVWVLNGVIGFPLNLPMQSDGHTIVVADPIVETNDDLASFKADRLAMPTVDRGNE